MENWLSGRRFGSGPESTRGSALLVSQGPPQPLDGTKMISWVCLDSLRLPFDVDEGTAVAHSNLSERLRFS